MTGLNTPVTPSQLREWLLVAIPSKHQTLIVGPPGDGKTTITYEAAAEAVCPVTKEVGADIVPMFPVVSDPTDFKGFLFSKDGKSAHFLPTGALDRLIKAKKLTVCLLDDLGQATKAVQSALMQLILARTVNGTKISDHVVFIGCTNDRSHKANVQAPLEPLKSRFKTILYLRQNQNDWVKWALKNDIAMEVIALIRFRPDLLFGFKPTNDFTNSSFGRTINHVSDIVKTGIPAGMEGPVISGAAGEVFAAEYIGFMKVWKSLPKLEEIRSNPDSAPVPSQTDPATLWATCGMIANAAAPKNMKWILKYAARLPKEFEVMLVTDCYTRDRDILDTREYATWVSNNNDVMMGGKN